MWILSIGKRLRIIQTLNIRPFINDFHITGHCIIIIDILFTIKNAYLDDLSLRYILYTTSSGEDLFDWLFLFVMGVLKGNFSANPNSLKLLSFMAANYSET